MSAAVAQYPRHSVVEFAPEMERTRAFSINREDLSTFARASGDRHPVHGDAAFARERGYSDSLVHGMLVAARCSSFVASDFVGSHGLLVAMHADFRYPVYCGDELIWTAKVTRVVPESGTVEIAWRVTNERGVIVVRGTACAALRNEK